ncbi:MAG: rod shape-determining protein MreD [Pseudomonadota bacterium]
MSVVKSRNRSGVWIIVSTFLVAFLLTVIPYPHWMQDAVPNWVTLVLFYWCLALPGRVGVGWGWLTGFVVDLIEHTLFGHHAIAKSLVAAVALAAHRRLRMYHLWQQCVVIFVVSVVELMLVYWIYNVVGGATFRFSILQSALATTLLWPFVYTLLRFIRQRNHITDRG